MRLLLIRHGEPRAAIDGVVAGAKGCTGLSELGRRQSEALRGRIERTGEIVSDVVLTSTLRRATETAQILSAVLGPATEDCGLCELHPGVCDGEDWSLHGHRYPSVAWPDQPFSVGGESLRSFDARIRDQLASLVQEYAESSVVVVGHSGVIEGMSLALMGLAGLAEKRRVEIDTLRYASITEWQIDGDVHRLHRYNDSAHLAGLPPFTSRTWWPA